MKKLELLSPAGDMERLKMSVLYGADAVYLAGTDFGMRSFAGNFSAEELPLAVKFAHEHGVKVHVTVNTMPRNDEVALLPEYLERLDDAGVDLPWPVNTPPDAPAMFPPSNPLPTMNVPLPGLILVLPVWYWPERSVWKRFGPFGKKPRKNWRSRPSDTVPCASAGPGGAC